MKVIPSKHAIQRLHERFKMKSFKAMLAGKHMVYRDDEDEDKYYINFYPDICVVLKKEAEDLYIITTVLWDVRDGGNATLEKIIYIETHKHGNTYK